MGDALRLTPILIISALFLWRVDYAGAQDIPVIEGRVSDAITGLPLPSSHIIIEGTPHATVADELGRFHFASLPPGKYSLKISHIGYKVVRISAVAVSYGIESVKDIRLVVKPIELPAAEVQSTVQPSEGSLTGGRVIGVTAIRSSGAKDIAGILEKEGLATITSDGAPGSRKTVSLRGSGSDQVLVLLDGIPLNDAADGTADLSQISLAEVQKIEVYPQAPAALGVNSIGGVINIVTLKPGIEKYRLAAGFSEFGEKQVSVLIGPEVAGWDILSFVEHRESNGKYKYRVVTDDGLDLFTRNIGTTFTRMNADYRRDYFSFKVKPPGILGLGYRRTLLFRHNPDYLPEPVIEHESTTEDDRHELSFTVSEGNTWYRPKFHLCMEGYKQKTLTDYGAGYPSLNNVSELSGEAYDAELSWRRKNFQWQDLHFGTGVRLERLWSGDLNGGYAERLHEFGYLQVQGNPFQDLRLPLRIGIITGVRADLYSEQKAFVYPRIGLEIGGGNETYWNVRGEMAGAYRLPSFNALFWQEDLQAEGNPNLKPERSLNEEISAKAGFEYAELGISYFNREVSDLIYWRLDFDNRWKPLNVAEAWLYGAEYSIRGNSGVELFPTEVSVSHQWIRAINHSGESNTDGKILPYRPQNTTTLSVRQYLKSFVVDVSARWVSRRYTNEANTKSLSPYQVWDVALSRDFTVVSSSTIIGINVQVRNLLNENYRIVTGAPVPLREFWVSVSLAHSHSS